MYPASYYQRTDDGRIQCLLCPHGCRLKDGTIGLCGVRQSRGGKLYTLNYGQVSSAALDPIEKKPLYHFFPGRDIVSLGTMGCNLKCGFCQNWSIAHGDPEVTELYPEQVVELALEQGGKNNLGIAYTYSEPLMWYEYVADTAVLARKQGLRNVLVTNGYINPEPLEELLPLVDALNIDVKGFTTDYYGKVCRGSLEPVLRTVEIASRSAHVEVTTLLVTGLNDSADEVRRLAEWLAEINPDIPLHLSRYFPNYQMDLPPTPEERMLTAYRTAREKLNYVYLGNLRLEQGSGRDTFCPECGSLLIERKDYRGRVVGLEAIGSRTGSREAIKSSGDLEATASSGKSAKCRNCGREIPVWHNFRSDGDNAG